MFLMLQERAVEDKPAAHWRTIGPKISLLTKHKEGAVPLNRTLLVFMTPSATAGTPLR